MTFTGAGHHQQTQKPVPMSIYLFKSIALLLFICEDASQGKHVLSLNVRAGVLDGVLLESGTKSNKGNMFYVCPLFLCAHLGKQVNVLQ